MLSSLISTNARRSFLSLIFLIPFMVSCNHNSSGDASSLFDSGNNGSNGSADSGKPGPERLGGAPESGSSLVRRGQGSSPGPRGLSGTVASPGIMPAFTPARLSASDCPSEDST